MLVFGWDAEVTEDECNKENVDHREEQFDEIESDELQSLFLSARASYPNGKKHRHAKPDGSPKERFAKTNDMGLPVKHTQIEAKKDDNTEDEGNPVPGGDVDQRKHVRATCVSTAKY